jgi:serine/threonine protein kinase/Tol biopolymer transport system component
MILTIGTQLGSLEIISLLGKGGMGEVYRARDNKLKREVAIKILPVGLSRAPDRLSRFQREAEVLASLNHPNIASIYGIEDSGNSPALVMELAEGSTLADRIRQGPVPVDEALAIARQIADALEYAHERGIIHRDLKPANVIVAADDTVKILDFGLAKALAPDRFVEEDNSNSPTISHTATRDGVLLGTAAYMSPEQARAKPVDRRSDIWAFGCVLYEMLTGKMAFRGDSVTDTLAAVIKSEPDWSQLPAVTPQHVRILLRRCLEKDARQRLQAMGEARISLDEGFPDPPETIRLPDVAASLRRRLYSRAIAVAAVLAALALLITFFVTAFAPRPASDVLLSEQITVSSERKTGPIVTDGTRVYFQSEGNPVEMSVRGGPIAPLRASVSGLRMLDVSPDGSEILALKPDQDYDTYTGSLWSVPVLGGSPRRLGAQIARSAHWSPDFRWIVYAEGNSVFVSREDGSDIRRIWDAPGGTDLPYFSPDSRRITVTVYERNLPARLWELNADGSSPHRLALDWPQETDMYDGRWTPDGKHFVFESPREYRGPNDVYELIRPRWFEFWRKPYAVRLTAGDIDVVSATPSHDSAGLFIIGQVAQGALQSFDPAQKRFEPFLGGFAASEFVISPDKKWMVYMDYPLHHLWRSKLDGSEKRQLTTSYAATPRWSPDSTRIVFSDWRQLYVISVEGDAAEPLIPNPNNEVWPAWSPDGKSIAFNDYPVPGQFVGIKIFDFATKKVSVMPDSKGFIMPTWSPDGKHMAAAASDPSRLVLYSAESQTWNELETRLTGNWVWSNDSHSIYLVQRRPERGLDLGLYRYSITEKKLTRLGELTGTDITRTSLSSFPSLTVDDRIVMMNDTSVFQIYFLKWN